MKKILSFTIILLTVINATAREASESLFTGSKIWTTRSISTAPPDYGGYTEFTETKLCELGTVLCSFNFNCLR